MNILWEFFLSNAILVTGMAAVVILVSRWISNAYVVRGLWLLVLVKLVTPPVYSYPVELPWGNESEKQVQTQKEVQTPAVSDSSIEDDGLASSWSPKNSEARERDASIQIKASMNEREHIATSEMEKKPIPTTVELSDSVKSSASMELQSNTPGSLEQLWNTIQNQLGNFAWSQTFVVVWIVGSLFFLALFVFRMMKFIGLMKSTLAAPNDIREKTKQLTKSFGLKKVPEIRMTNERVSPFVWGTFFRTEIVLPRGLILQMSEEARTTLIAHELSHLQRNDHLVRWLETVVTILYWWHPVVWWARRELRELEEMTCDATVVARLPDVAKTYAHALMDTVDFLSGAKPILPPLACGVAPVHSLRKRITCIMNNNRRPTVTWWGRIILVAAAFSLLPFSVGLAQKKSESDEASQAVKKALQEASKAIKEAEALIQKSKDKNKNKDNDNSRRTRRSRSSHKNIDKDNLKRQIQQALKQVNQKDLQKQIENAFKQAHSAHSQVDQKKIQRQIQQALEQINQKDIHKHIEKALKHAHKLFDSAKIHKHVQQALKHAQNAHKHAFDTGKLRKQIEKALKQAKAEGKDFDEKEVRAKIEKAMKVIDKIKVDIDFSSIEKSVNSAMKAVDAAMKQFKKNDLKDLEKKIKEAHKKSNGKNFDFEQIEKQIEKSHEQAEEALEGIEEEVEINESKFSKR